MNTFTEQEQTKVYQAYDGWTAETRVKISGKNWIITTSKRSRGGISTHCHAVQDEGNGSFSFVMLGSDAKEDFHVNILPNVRCTEKAIREAHSEGLKQFYAKKDAGELPVLTEEETVKIGTVLFTDWINNVGAENRRAVYAIEGNRYKTVSLDGSQLQTDDFVRPYSKKFGIGVYFKPNDFITLDEINELIPQAKANMEIKAKQDAIKREEEEKAAAKKREYLSQFKRADRRTTTEILKRHIRATWPAVQMVGIKTDVFSGGDSMDVTYHASERINELEAFVQTFREGRFDGMSDMYEYNQNREEIILEGYILQSYKYASTHWQQCEAKPIPEGGEFVNGGLVWNLSDKPNMARIVHNAAKDGIEIYFPSKPNAAILDNIKLNGFRWGKFNKCWYARVSTRALETAAKYGSLPSTLSPEAIDAENERQSVMSYIDAQEQAAYERG